MVEGPEAIRRLMEATEISTAYLEGRVRPLQVAIRLCQYIDPWQPIWEATKGAAGPLSNLYLAADEADRIGFIGDNEELWHPDVLPRKRAELAEVEARLEQPVRAACHPRLRVLERFRSRRRSKFGLTCDPAPRAARPAYRSLPIQAVGTGGSHSHIGMDI
jgi:hypothetical protein